MARGPKTHPPAKCFGNSGMRESGQGALMPRLKAAVKLAMPEPLRRVKRSLDRIERARKIRRSCIESIRAAFPEIRFKRVELILSGFDHVVVVLDDAWVFRFPQTEFYRANLTREVAILRVLSASACVRIPDYRHVAPSNAFGGYALVRGRELTPRLFHSLDRDAQCSALRQISGFLGAMHGLPPSLLEGPDGTGQGWLEHQRFSRSELEGCSDSLDGWSKDALKRFFRVHGQAPQGRQCVTHTALKPDHVLLSRQDGRVGIIDFADVALGDPAWDFAIIGSYDDWVCPYMIEHYAFAAEDPDLLERSRQQAVRFWGRRLYRRVQGINTRGRVSDIAAMLRSSLERVRM
jgi:aminoglycoside 2''-phosphotransferase